MTFQMVNEHVVIRGVSGTEYKVQTPSPPFQTRTPTSVPACRSQSTLEHFLGTPGGIVRAAESGSQGPGSRDSSAASSAWKRSLHLGVPARRYHHYPHCSGLVQYLWICNLAAHSGRMAPAALPPVSSDREVGISI